MKPVKTIAAVGVAADTLQELKDAIAASAARLDSEWQWASDQNPDLLVIDPGDFAARMARTRAQVTGVRYMVVGDAAKHATDRFVLLKPYRQDALAAVLNAAGSATVASSEFVQQDDSFYTMDYEDSGVGPDLQVDLRDARSPDTVAGAAQGLDEMIRGDPLAEPAPDPSQVRIPVDATVAPSGEATLRSASRREQTLERMGRVVTAAVPAGAVEARVPGIPMPSMPAPVAPGENAGHGLERYLDGELLGGPSRAALEGAPALVLDPKQRVFHSSGDLTALVAYCMRPLLRREWHAINSAELAEAREAAAGRPYADLLWLLALLRGEGRLAPHLDPGGSFRIARPVAVAAAFHAHGPIAAAMHEPLRLHEIAAASGASMEQVFDIVNAYDAVGELHWTPRPPRHADPVGKPPERGLLARLAGRLRGR